MSQQPPPPGWVPPPPPAPAAPPPGVTYGGPSGWSTPPAAWYPAPLFKPGVVALRPLGLGDLFDGAFRTIRRNPGSMVGLAALVTTAFMVVPVAITLLLAGLGELDLGLPTGTGAGASGDELSVLDSGTVTLVSNLGTFFGFFATVLLNGMLVHVVAEAVLGRRTSAGQAWAATRGRMWRLVGLMLLDLLMVVLLVGVPVLAGVVAGMQAGVLAGFVVGVPSLVLAVVVLVVVQVRYFQLAAPALVLEREGVFAALRRGGQLSRGQFWRILGVVLLTGLVAGLVGQVLAVPLAVAGAVGALLVPGTGGALVLVFSTYLAQVLVGAVTTPFTSAVVALQYVDQRIRKEGLDVQLIAASQHPPSR